ncbi:MAG TPA: hypothetical protein VHT97_03860 [Acidimicrobiales bacterium]|nr:hypothetical protein [Acidimicrobiales bacterium]
MLTKPLDDPPPIDPRPVDPPPDDPPPVDPPPIDPVVPPGSGDEGEAGAVLSLGAPALLSVGSELEQPAASPPSTVKQRTVLIQRPPCAFNSLSSVWPVRQALIDRTRPGLERRGRTRSAGGGAQA